ncbi:MAG: hypothetical protein M3R15_11270 [Acidobacteriota bacterium]|nr:hypothetical protein [Acidobacteriota bacterium]
MTRINVTQDSQQDFHVKLRSEDGRAFKLLIETLKSFVRSCNRFYDPASRE